MEESFIRSRRRALGLSVPEIAESVGVSETAVWRWDRGKSHPRISHYSAIADALKVSSEELRKQLDGVETENVRHDSIAQCLDEARHKLSELTGLNVEDIELHLKIVSKNP